MMCALVRSRSFLAHLSHSLFSHVARIRVIAHVVTGEIKNIMVVLYHTIIWYHAYSGYLRSAATIACWE